MVGVPLPLVFVPATEEEEEEEERGGKESDLDVLDTLFPSSSSLPPPPPPTTNTVLSVLPNPLTHSLSTSSGR